MIRAATIVALCALAGCSNAANNTATADAGRDVGTSPGPDAGPIDATASPDGTTGDVGTGVDATEPDADTEPDVGPVEMLTESEPNDGSTLQEVNELPIGAQMSGNVDAADADAYLVDARAGQLYRATLIADAGSQLERHLTVFDAGRDADPPSDDYIKIVRGESVTFLGMGEGGYYVVVRDARNVDGAAVGGAGFGYTLRVEEIPLSSQPLTFGTPLTGTLDSAGGVDLWSFDGTEGMNVRFDFSTDGDLDGRLFVFSEVTGSWIARQDNRTAGDPNPLLDAPLFGSGPMLLVVESIAEQASGRGYRIDATNP